MTSLRMASRLLGTALVLLFYSELLFFNEDVAAPLIHASWGTALFHLAQMTFFYLVAALALHGATDIRANASWAHLMVAGAFYGLVVEGALVPAIYEAPPVSLLWTALSWHPLVDVVLGLGVLQLALRARSARVTALAFVGMGCVWGLWSTWVIDVVALEPIQFARFAFVSGGVWIVGFALLEWGMDDPRALPRAVRAATFLLVAFLFVLQGWTYGLWSVVVLALAGAFLLVLRSSPAPRGHDAAAFIPPRWQRFALGPLAPAVAVASFAVARHSGIAIDIELAALAIMVVSAGTLALAIRHVLRSRKIT